ncbi:VWA domain-containing protein [uncultured Fibrobacter sp.]|uniref:VWA domain-containing protein n=1 Tax=uncultured Fibrobacter sp. TaxID=261512 RepID=UPI0025F2F8DA|nr:VWA domain-containing protein [uncultured Fibrobacter sp.]
MGRKINAARKYTQKAIKVIDNFVAKYPDGIKDINLVNEEKQAWIERSIQIIRENVKHVWFPNGKPKWFESLRVSRNTTSHQTEFSDKKTFEQLCKNFCSNISDILRDLRTILPKQKKSSMKKSKFENFAPSSTFGSKADRMQLVDAMEDMASPVEPTDIKIEFPQNNYAKLAEETFSDILDHDDIKDYIQSHEGASENIQTDILEWLQQTRETLDREDPFLDESIFIQQQKKLSAIDVATDLTNENSKIQYHYRRLPSVSESKRGSIAPSNLNFNFYKNQFAEQKKEPKKDGKDKAPIQWKSMEQLEVLRRNFIGDMEECFIDRKNKWEQERIDEMQKAFLEELYKKIQNFKRLEKLLSPFIKNFGRLWDLSEGIFETSGFEILEQFAKLLEQDQSLQELAEILGKHNRAQSIFEKELRDKVVIKTEWHPQNAYRGEIKGICFSNDISSVLPSELALMKNPATKKLFQLRFAQKQLLSFEYQRNVARTQEESTQEEVSIEKKEPKGPIIICVDTSGSMHGTPENIAKTITFALSKIALEEERKCYLISFSTGIETLDMSDFKKGDSLQKLVRFLQMSFNGGTDAGPALRHAIQMLQSNDYKNADVLMISDFIMANLPSDLINAIEVEKENNTEFYSLVIGISGNQGTIDCFNHNWSYNTNDIHASRHLVEQLHSIKMRPASQGKSDNADK